MAEGIKLVKDAVSKHLDKMLSRAQSSQATSRVYAVYQRLQTARFMTQNSSEGAAWPSLSPEYAAYKLKRFATYPGSGSKMLIATSTLAGAVIGPGSPFEGIDKHTALFKPYSMQIQVVQGGTNAEGKKFNYPQYVAETRPFMSFSPKSIQEMKDTLMKFMVGK